MQTHADRFRTITFGEFLIDQSSGELYRGTDPVPIQGKPLELLLALLDRPGRVVSREELYERLWPQTVVDYRASLDTAMKKLRRALQPSGAVTIETVQRRGYRLNASVAIRLRTPVGTREASVAVAD